MIRSIEETIEKYGLTKAIRPFYMDGKIRDFYTAKELPDYEGLCNTQNALYRTWIKDGERHWKYIRRY